MSPNPSFAELMRSNDHFHPAQDRAQLMEVLFPASPFALAEDLSNVTSLFYGLLLQVAADRYGVEAVDALSRELFYRLGRAKARATYDQKSGQLAFHGDVRDLVTILISAIYNASPEYRFNVERFDPDSCVVVLTGVDRYYRAATTLALVPHLRFPTLHRFFEGIRDELSIACDVQSELLSIEPEARLTTRYVFRAHSQRQPAGK